MRLARILPAAHLGALPFGLLGILVVMPIAPAAVLGLAPASLAWRPRARRPVVAGEGSWRPAPSR